jgi:hypothetical protein
MARPKISYTGKVIGSLKIGQRVNTSIHARYEYTCMACDAKGESDARYLVSGCQACKTKTTPENSFEKVQVATGSELFHVPVVKLVATYRENPNAQYYYKGKRVTLSENDEDIFMSGPPVNGQPQVDWFSKFNQELGEHSIIQPEGLHRAKAQTHTTPEKSAPAEKQTLADMIYTPPEGALELLRDSHKVWVHEDNIYPVDETMPQYILDWCNAFPKGYTFRAMYANKQWFGMPVKPRVSAMDRYDEITDDDDEPSPQKPFVPKLVQSAESKRATLVEDMGEEAVLAMEAAEVQKKIDAQTRKQAFNDFVAGKDLIKG